MVSTRGRTNCARRLALPLLLIGLTSGCIIGRLYIGSELPTDLREKITVGTSTKPDILRALGPPDTMRHQFDGDLFIYRYVQRNSAALDIAEPVVTHLTLFSYSRVQQKDDSLVILFDRDGVVRSFGFRRGTAEMTPY